MDLEQKGDEWWGLSCFRDEKTPSFSVRKDPPVFYDFSSGLGGNVFTFTKHYFDCSTHQAIEKLRKYVGYNGVVGFSSRKMAATSVCKRFKPVESRSKVSSVKIFPDDYMKRYEKDEEKLARWEQEGISRASLDRFQVYYDKFSDRLVYPIRNLDGKIVNIGGRTLDPEWKAKDLRKYCYFHSWGTIETIYGLAENRESIVQNREVILFEGCKSVLMADTWGIRNCGAILTSHLNAAQMKILAKLGCRVVFALDKDVDIRKDHNINKLKQYVRVEYLYDRHNKLDEKDSPVDKGLEVFLGLYNDRIKLR